MKPWRQSETYEIAVPGGKQPVRGVRLSRDWATHLIDKQRPQIWSLDHVPTGTRVATCSSVDHAETLAQWLEAERPRGGWKQYGLAKRLRDTWYAITEWPVRAVTP